MGVLKKLFNNAGKPSGFLGKLMLSGMNAGHSAVSDWGMGHLPKIKPTAIGEFGCGGGRNVGELLRRYPTARLTALDYSPASVEKTKQMNKAIIDAGRCDVVRGNVGSLPFADHVFDLVTAFETVYFWPGLADCFGEVYRVLKHSGVFLIVNESDGEKQGDDKWSGIIDGMTIYDAGQLSEFLRQAGFAEISAHRDEKKHWLCIVARKNAYFNG